MHYIFLSISKKIAYILRYKGLVFPRNPMTEIPDLYLHQIQQWSKNSFYSLSTIMACESGNNSVFDSTDMFGSQWMVDRMVVASCVKKGAYSSVQFFVTIVPGSSCKGRRLY